MPTLPGIRKRVHLPWMNVVDHRDPPEHVGDGVTPRQCEADDFLAVGVLPLVLKKGVLVSDGSGVRVPGTSGLTREFTDPKTSARSYTTMYGVLEWSQEAADELARFLEENPK